MDDLFSTCPKPRSIEADGGRGLLVTRGLADVVDVKVVPVPTSDAFGQIQNGYIDLIGTMHRLKVAYSRFFPLNPGVPMRFCGAADEENPFAHVDRAEEKMVLEEARFLPLYVAERQ